MTYLSECLTDSPTLIFPMDTYSSGYADSSGNSRNLNILSGTAPASTATGPDGVANDAAAWGTASGHLRTTYTQASPSVGTFELWFRYASAPSVNVRLANWCPNTGSNGSAAYITLRSDGKIAFGVYDGTNEEALSPSALSTDTWHHVVCMWGSGGQVLRVDKVTLATGSKTSASTSAGAAFRVHGQYNGSSDTSQVGAVDMAWAAFYPTKLTTTRTDAHYDAMGPSSAASGSASLSLSASGSAGATGAGSASLSLSASGGTSAAAAGSASLTLSASGALTPPSPASGSAALSLSASGGASGSPAGSASLNLTATGTALAVLAASGSATLTLTASGSAVMSAAGSATLTLSAGGIALALFTTDTSNALDGLDLLLTARVIFAVPIATPPASAAAKYDKALAYPTPTMVGGRPT